MYTPGPATSLSTSVFGFPQNEHEAIRDFRMVTAIYLSLGVVRLRDVNDFTRRQRDVVIEDAVLIPLNKGEADAALRGLHRCYLHC
jgi:hypothetical protein